MQVGDGKEAGPTIGYAIIAKNWHYHRRLDVGPLRLKTEDNCTAVKQQTREELQSVLPPGLLVIVLEYYHRDARDRLDALLFELEQKRGEYPLGALERRRIGQNSTRASALAVSFSTLYCRIFSRPRPKRLVELPCTECRRDGHGDGSMRFGRECPWCRHVVTRTDHWAPLATKAFGVLAKSQPHLLTQAAPLVLALTRSSPDA